MGPRIPHTGMRHQRISKAEMGCAGAAACDATCTACRGRLGMSWMPRAMNRVITGASAALSRWIGVCVRRAWLQWGVARANCLHGCLCATRLYSMHAAGLTTGQGGWGPRQCCSLDTQVQQRSTDGHMDGTCVWGIAGQAKADTQPGLHDCVMAGAQPALHGCVMQAQGCVTEQTQPAVRVMW
jgi:hypothetical protein